MRRIGSTPQQRGSLNEVSCPDILEFELDDGRYAVIGTLIAAADLGLDTGGTVVVITRQTLVDAKRDLP